jgi:hypothetical protein
MASVLELSEVPYTFHSVSSVYCNQIYTFTEVLVNGMTEHKRGGVVSAPGGTCSISLDSVESLNQYKHNIEYPISRFLQFYILLKRTFLSTMRDQVIVCLVGFDVHTVVTMKSMVFCVLTPVSCLVYSLALNIEIPRGKYNQINKMEPRLPQRPAWVK